MARRTSTRFSFHLSMQQIPLKEKERREQDSRRSDRNRNLARERGGTRGLRVARVSWLLPLRRLLLGRAAGAFPGFRDPHRQPDSYTPVPARTSSPVPNPLELQSRLHENPTTFGRTTKSDRWVGLFYQRVRQLLHLAWNRNYS